MSSRVTPLRSIFGKMSGSRNEAPSQYNGPSIDAGSCHWCRQKFQRGQMRYPMVDSTFKSYPYELVSLCLECFKLPDANSVEPEDWIEHIKGARPNLKPRQEHTCPGCGEPIFVSPDLRWSLKFCSLRCYQRNYRKRRRRTGSAIDWKGGERGNLKCATCKKLLPDNKRLDAKFCSNACRQKQYRRRNGRTAQCSRGEAGKWTSWISVTNVAHRKRGEK
jgi:endogenous inhibitor of DNA gyrase (YacG/DUF329 family)